MYLLYWNCCKYLSLAPACSRRDSHQPIAPTCTVQYIEHTISEHARSFSYRDIIDFCAICTSATLSTICAVVAESSGIQPPISCAAHRSTGTDAFPAHLKLGTARPSDTSRLHSPHCTGVYLYVTRAPRFGISTRPALAYHRRPRHVARAFGQRRFLCLSSRLYGAVGAVANMSPRLALPAVGTAVLRAQSPRMPSWTPSPPSRPLTDSPEMQVSER